MLRFCKLLVIVLLGVMPAVAWASSPAGKWRTVDDKTGQVESVVRIWESDGKMFGAVDQLYTQPRDVRCDRCRGDQHNQRVEGMTIMWDLVPEGKGWGKGHVLDPKDGKVYNCKIEVSPDGKTLSVRGFVGVSLFGRTQKWHRAD
jgi:uncharacterized protein (DUF2147 family)